MKRLISDFCPGQHWGCTAGSHPHICSTAAQGGVFRKDLVGTWGGTGSSWQCLALGAQGGCQGHTLGSALSPGLPQQKSQPFAGKTPPLGSWVLKKTPSSPCPAPCGVCPECGGGSVEFPAAHRDSEGFSELAPLTCCLPLVKGQLGVGPSGIAPQAESWAAPRPVQITQEQRGQALPCLCSSILAADCWNICQLVLGCFLRAVVCSCLVFFLFDFAKFCFLSPSVEDGAWNSELLAGLGH